MNTTEILKSLIDLGTELNSCYHIMHYEIDNELYSELYDILIKKLNSEEAELLTTLDEMVGGLLSSTFDQGVIAGMELSNNLIKILNEPEHLYHDMLKSFNIDDVVYREARELIYKYKEK